MALAWAVVGLCLNKTVNFSEWGEAIVNGRAKYAASHQRRFSRFFANKRIKPLKFYYPLLNASLKDWPLEKVLYLALDVSDLKNGYILVRLGLIFRGRTVPVAWRVMKHNSASVSYRDYKVLLKQALIVLPVGHSIVLLADRGFVYAELVKFCRKQRWGHRLRAKSNNLVRLADRSVKSFGLLCPSKGQVAFYQNVHILGENIGPVNIALANPEGDEEPWYIISDAPADLSTLDDYALRFDIEEGFLDDKSNGFQVESAKLTVHWLPVVCFLLAAVNSCTDYKNPRFLFRPKNANFGVLSALAANLTVYRPPHTVFWVHKKHSSDCLLKKITPITHLFNFSIAPNSAEAIERKAPG